MYCGTYFTYAYVSAVTVHHVSCSPHLRLSSGQVHQYTLPVIYAASSSPWPHADDSLGASRHFARIMSFSRKLGNILTVNTE